MSKTDNMIFAGFGGQGILFSAKIVAYAGMLYGKEVSWLPSYGPEMRGGTANCSVIVSDDAVASPLVSEPDILVALNLPSYEKFIDSVKPGGCVFADSSLIESKCKREDIKVFYIPCTKLANDNDLHGLANMIALGKLITETKILPMDIIMKAIEKSIPARKADMFESNKRAIAIGCEY